MMDTQRLILFFVFSFSLLMLWEAWQKETRGPQAPVASTPQAVPSPTVPSQGAVPSPAPKGAAAGAAPSVPPGGGAGTGRERVRVTTDMFTVEIDTTGGDVVY